MDFEEYFWVKRAEKFKPKLGLKISAKNFGYNNENKKLYHYMQHFV